MVSRPNFITRLKPCVLMLLFWCLLTKVHGQGFQSITPLQPVSAVKNTGEKPQSKVWKYDGQWWAVFPATSGTYIWRLDGTTWTNTTKISSSTSVEADCKVAGNLCHIFLWRNGNNASQLISLEYNLAAKSYELWKKRSSTVFIQLDSGAETGTIDIDGTGRMWLASDGLDDMRVRWSDSPYAAWSLPVTVASGTTDDDICAVIALPVQRQIGILWSDQNSKRFGFKTHRDEDPPTVWSDDEIPASRSALDIGKGMGDDHLNLALASDGTLYGAVKTSYDTPGYTRLGLLKRSPSGTWDDLYNVSETGTRAIVVLNDSAGTLKVVYTSQEHGGEILYRESSIFPISFGPALTLIAGAYDNPTSSKDAYQSDIVILASDGKTIVSILGRDHTLITGVVSPESGESVVGVYPNPVDDELLTVNLDEAITKDFSISISDASGKIYNKNNQMLQGRRIEVNLSEGSLPPGAYFLKLQTPKYSRVFNFIKK